MKRSLKYFSGFFPVQLLLLHLRRSWLLLFFWGVLFGMSGGFMFKTIGIPYLFQTPEYLGDVNFLAYFIIGILLGFFVMAFHITSYIFYSYRFTFLATTTRPLYRFAVNNSVIPIFFYVFYGVVVAKALHADGLSVLQIILNELGIILGSVVSLSLSFTYFFSILRHKGHEGDEHRVAGPLAFFIKKSKKISDAAEDEHVFTYLRNFKTIRRVRPSGHYDEVDRLRILQQHHTRAALFFIAILLLVLLLNIFTGNRFTLIPAGGSIVLILTTFLMIFGAVFSWLKTWTISVFVFGLLLLNYLSGLPSLKRTAKVPGLNYEAAPLPYTYKALAGITTDSIVAYDEANMLAALNGWKKRQSETKPRLIIFNASGGGLRSSLFTLASMQYLDSLTKGKFYDRIFLLAGSSGGMIGAAYYRELKQQNNQGHALAINGKRYFNALGADILNAVGFSMAVNDYFIPLQTFTKAGYRYPRDRGVAWDERFSQNTGGILNKSINSYRAAEAKGEIPLLILSPTIINRGQRLLMSPMGLSFLARYQPDYQTRLTDLYDGVEFSRFFADRQADSLSFITALRMSSTFPYITPVVALPTQPPMEVLDAGARDNDGLLLTLRFLHTFKEWIAENTCGVLIVQSLASRPVYEEIKANPYNTRIENLVKPVGAMVQNFSTLQGFARAEMLNYASDWVSFPLEVVQLDLMLESDEVSLSWHLTRSEKAFIYKTVRGTRLEKRYARIVHECK